MRVSERERERRVETNYVHRVGEREREREREGEREKEGLIQKTRERLCVK
jgi:hypothetical protein